MSNVMSITLFRSITKLCGNDNIQSNIYCIQYECRKLFSGTLSVPHNIVMDLNNVPRCLEKGKMP